MQEADISGVDPASITKVAIDSSDELTRAAGVDIAATLAREDPENSISLIKSLIEVLSKMENPSVKGTAIRALATIGAETSTKIIDADSTFSNLLQSSSDIVRKEAAINLPALIIKDIDEFRKTANSFGELIEDDIPEISLAAIKTIAIISKRDPEMIGDMDNILGRLKKLENDPYLPTTKVIKARRLLEGQSREGNN